MSSRTVAVILTAQVENYMRQMRDAQRQTDEVDRAARSATQQLAAHNEALTKVGTGMAAVGAAAAVALGVAVKAASEYGAKMAELRTLSGATSNEMSRLSDAAMKQGTAFGFSATQVADAEIELTKAGRSAAQMLNGDLKGALALAAAGQLDVGKATQIGVSALTQFKATGATIPQVADALAAGSAKALGSVEDLGMALQQGGLVASQMGLDLNDTVGTLSAFAQAGLLGSDAGTSFKTMLLSLQSPSTQAQKALDQYNISAYDAQGNFVGIADLAGQLKTAFAGVDQASRDAALSTIFGSDAIRAANVLYTQGKAGIEDWIAAVDDSGYASAQAAGKLDSLQGDLQKLSAAFQTDLIKAGQSGDGAFRGLVQSGTSLITMLGDLNPGVMGVAVGATTLVAGVGLLGGAFLLAIPKIVAFRAAMTELGVSGRGLAGIFGKGSAILLGITAMSSGLAATGQIGTASAQQVSRAGDAIKMSWAGVDDLFDKTGDGAKGLKQALGDEGDWWTSSAAGAKLVDGLTFGITHLSDVYKTNEGTFDALGQQLAGLAQQDYGRASQSFAELVRKYDLGGDEVAELLRQMPAYRDELVKQAGAANVAATDANLLQIAQGKGAAGAKVLAAAQAAAAKSAAAQAEGIAGLRGEAVSAQGSIEDLASAIAGFGSVTLDARAAQRDFRKAVEDAKDALKDGSKTDDEKQAALDGIARAGIASAASLAKMPGGAKKAESAMRDARKEFVDAAADMLGSRTAAKKLADQLGLIPENVKTAVEITGVEAAKAKAKELVNGLPRYFYLDARVRSGEVTPGPPAAIAAPVKRAGGGPIDGRGPKGVDSVYAILAPGEHVFTASEVDRMGGQSAVSMFRADLMQSFARGGAVGQSVLERGRAEFAAALAKNARTNPVNAIQQQKNIADREQQRADEYQADVIAQKKRIEAAEEEAAKADKAVEKAQKRYDEIDGKKKNAAAKKAAKEAVEDAKKAAEKKARRVENATEEADELREKRDAARERAKAATESAAQLRLDREDFVSAERRDPDRASTNPLAYVDQLRQMSRDENYSDAKRQKFKDTANEYERSLARMTEQASKAADELKTLQDSSKQLHDSIAQAITGGYGLAGAAESTTTATESGWFERDGIRFATSGTQTSGPTASSIARSYAVGATRSGQFADALQALAGRGLNTSLLAELAGMGTEQGYPIAQALLAGSDSEVAAVNYNYNALGAQGWRAGGIVADATYGQQIATANGHLQQINRTLTEDGQKLRHLIATALGVSGYATGTASATAGLHWVGERGPELVGLRAGDPVATAAASKQWVQSYAGGSGGAAPSVTVQAPQVVFPDTITVRDATGFEMRMQVIADQRIAADAAADAVLMMGGQT